jgi:hypothetical protein
LLPPKQWVSLLLVSKRPSLSSPMKLGWVGIVRCMYVFLLVNMHCGYNVDHKLFNGNVR